MSITRAMGKLAKNALSAGVTRWFMYHSTPVVELPRRQGVVSRAPSQ